MHYSSYCNICGYHILPINADWSTHSHAKNAMTETILESLMFLMVILEIMSVLMETVTSVGFLLVFFVFLSFFYWWPVKKL